MGVFTGSVDIPNNNPHIKSVDFKVFKATHPLVSILGVCVNALVDRGSMRSFTSDKVHAVFDFNNFQSSHVHNARFVSITGGPLNIKCSVNCNIKFPKSKYLYYDCVLGWYFLAANRLELAQGVIEPSDSPCSSPIVLVRKKDSQLRFRIDFRRVNSVSTCPANPLPRTDDILDSFNGAKLVSTLDLHSRY